MGRRRGPDRLRQAGPVRLPHRDPDAALFPYQSWRRLLARQLRPTTVGAGAYGDPAGHPGLREAIARHIGLARGVQAGAEEVVVTNGTQQAVDLVARVLLAPGDRVAVESPGYGPPRRLMASLGAEVVGVPVDDQGLVVEAIPPRTRLVYVTPSHQFPLGMAMSLPRRLALLVWAERHDAAVVEDDYDSEFRYGGRPIEPLQTLDPRGRVIYVGSFSKTLLATLRLGSWSRRRPWSRRSAAPSSWPTGTPRCPSRAPWPTSSTRACSPATCARCARSTSNDTSRSWSRWTAGSPTS